MLVLRNVEAFGRWRWLGNDTHRSRLSGSCGRLGWFSASSKRGTRTPHAIFGDDI